MKSLPSINPKQEVNKLIGFLKKTLKEQKIDKVVLGLSGGIDSMTVLYLLKEVLPARNIFAVQMDYYPRKKLNIDLRGINVVNVPIKKIVDEFQIENKIRLGNIMARVRMIILFDLAKQLNALVCGTENKSERLLGYFTRFGDSASDIEPISHLYKTQVRQLTSYLKVPKKIIDQSPTAGLWNGQTDEKDFGFTYEEADQVLYYLERFYSHSRPRSESRAGFNGNPELMDPRFHGDDTKHLKILINKLMKDFPNAEKIIERMEKNQFKLATPYHL